MLKKKIALVILLVFCAAGLFAQLNVNGGADIVLVPLQIVTRDTVEDEGNMWLGAGIGGNGALYGIRTRLNLSGNYEDKAGFRTDIWFLYTNNGANLWDQPAGNNPNSPNTRNPNALEVRLGDYGEIWWKPAEWLKFNVGRIVDTSQTGYIGDYWLSAWSAGMFDYNNIFSYFYSGGIGVLAKYTPTGLDGLTIGLFVPQFGMGFSEADYDDTWPGGNLLTNGADKLNDFGEDNVNRNANRAFRVFQRTWLTVGYEVPDLLHARIQYIGANPGGMVNWTEGDNKVDVEAHRYRVGVSAPRIEAAFAWLGIPGFALDLGVKSWLPVSNWITDTYDNEANKYIRLENTGTYWGGIGFGFGVSFYELMDGKLALNFRADGDMFRSWKGTYQGVNAAITNPLRLSFHLWPSYTIPELGTITVSAGLNYIGRNTVDIGGTNPNENSEHWEDAERLRFGAGLAFEMPVFKSGSVSVGIAYGHGTGERNGGEPRTITIPVYFFYHW
ncbi:MAG: hypothetical protein LBB72_03850 [Spirochaetaceae bacterium]|jgi:hypothetical protein|nr:hypothetical protein [Spirochaetaceae bacterium]